MKTGVRGGGVVTFSGAGVGSALAERASGRKSAAVATWAELVRMAADGGELSADDIARLETASDLLEIDDVEDAFNSDVQLLRNIHDAETTLSSPEWSVDVLMAQGRKAADDAKRLREELNRAESDRRVVASKLDSRGSMLRELGAMKAKASRLVGE